MGDDPANEHAAQITQQYSCLSLAQAEQIAQDADLFSDPMRVRIIDVLRRYGDTITVTEVGETIGISQETVSYHLRLLRIAGLVVFRRHETKVYYRLDTERLRAKITALAAKLEGLL